MSAATPIRDNKTFILSKAFTWPMPNTLRTDRSFRDSCNRQQMSGEKSNRKWQRQNRYAIFITGQPWPVRTLKAINQGNCLHSPQMNTEKGRLVKADWPRINANQQQRFFPASINANLRPMALCFVFISRKCTRGLRSSLNRKGAAPLGAAESSPGAFPRRAKRAEG